MLSLLKTAPLSFLCYLFDRMNSSYLSEWNGRERERRSGERSQRLVEKRKRRGRARSVFHFLLFLLRSSLSTSFFFSSTTMPPFLLSSSTPAAAEATTNINNKNKNARTVAAAPSSSFLPADRRAARRGLWREWAQAPERGSLFAVDAAAVAALSEWATAWLAASTAESDLTSMLHSEVMVRACLLEVNEAEGT